MAETKYSRRGLLRATGAAGITSLAGCASFLEGDQEEERPEQDTPPKDNNQTDDSGEGPSNETDDPDDTEEGSNDPEASSYTWEDVREVDQEYTENLADNELVDRMLSGEQVPGPFDLEEAKNIDLSDYEEVKELLNDTAMTFYEQKEDERGSDRALSTLSENAAFTQQLIIEELIDKKIEVIPAGNDGHGFHYTKIEDHPISIVDVNVGVGRVNTGHLDGTINGQEIPGEDEIANFEKEDMTEGSETDILINTGGYQNLLGGLYGGEDMKVVGFDTKMLPDIYNNLKDSGDQIFNRIKPAIATTHYEIHENSDQYEHGFAVINAESLEDLPELDTDNFDQYREELFSDFVDIVSEEEITERCYNQ